MSDPAPTRAPARPSFEEVLAGAQQGAEWAMAAIYSDLRGPVFSYLRSLVPGEAEDLTSEVFVAVVGGVWGFEGDAVEFRSWVFTIAHHRAADHRRKAARRRTIPVPNEQFIDRPSKANTETDAVDACGDDSALRRVAALPPAQAQALYLRVVADLSVGQVAAIMGRRPGAVRALHFRALRRLARELAAEKA